jgi:pyrimidine operon attenuation protein/uracil phosphoribosyltransferase
MPTEKTLILDHVQVSQKITRMAHELYEQHHKSKSLFLIGISGNGNRLAALLADKLREISPLEITHLEIVVDKASPTGKTPELNGKLSDLKGRSVILVDDVLNSGKTLIHAANHILQVELKQLSVVTLIERLHRRFPIKANVVGLTLSTNLKENVAVDLSTKAMSVHLEA